MSGKMEFAPEFVQRLKDAFPELFSLDLMLKAGMVDTLFTFLSSHASGGVDATYVLLCLDGGRPDAVRAATERAVKRQALYREFCVIVSQQPSPGSTSVG